MSPSSPLVVQLCRSAQDDFDLSKLLRRRDIQVSVCLHADACFDLVRQGRVSAVILDLEHPSATGLALRIHLEEAGARPIVGLIAPEYPEFIKNWSKSFWIPSPIRASAAIERIELFIDLGLAEAKIEGLLLQVDEEQQKTEAAVRNAERISKNVEKEILSRTRQFAANIQTKGHKPSNGFNPDHPILNASLLNQTLNVLPLMVYFKDSTSRFVYLNHQLASFLRKDQDEVLGRLATSLPEPLAGLFDKESDDKALETPGGIHGERRIHLDGKIKTLLFGKQAFTVEGIEKPYLLGYGLDLSDQKVMEEKFSQTQKLEALGTMAGGIAHDFNNLLFAMLLNLSLIQRSTAEERREHYIGQMRQACERAKEMTGQILTFSKQQEHQITSVDLTEIIDEVHSLSRSVTPKNIRFERSYRCLNPNCLADPSQLHQVLMNLVNNASYALGTSGGHITLSLADIEVDAQDHISLDLKPGNYLKVGVQDDGPGIPSEILPRIFDPFFSTKPSDEGTGLGLAVAMGIVQRIKGCITVVSNKDSGTRFDVYLPQTEKPLARGDQRPLPLYAGKLVGFEKCLVVVEDEILVLRPLCDFLEDEGFKVVPFENPSLALEYCKDHLETISLVLTDQNMPEMSGLALCRQLSECRSDLPLILYSGYSSQLTLELAIEAGAKLLLSKPLRQEELLDAIKQLMV